MEIRKLKYQDLIDEQNLKLVCPNSNSKFAQITAYRWTFFPIENEDNFLPKLIYDKKKNIPHRINSNNESLICSSCGLSMFNSEINASKKFFSIPLRNRKLLGYTHISKGNLDNHGLMSEISKTGHFDFFEFIDVDLKNKFSIDTELTNEEK
ncbi:MAG: hypothetical protein K8R54_19645 [Bacteroidales bacterium]|nr:hypothetical protein [Bacteroidales bacterium]